MGMTCPTSHAFYSSYVYIIMRFSAAAGQNNTKLTQKQKRKTRIQHTYNFSVRNVILLIEILSITIIYCNI